MAIKTYEEWKETLPTVELNDNHAEQKWMAELAGRTFAEYAYQAGVKAASVHFEEEKIKIHEYYTAKLAELFDHEPPKGSDKNNGRLT